MKGTPLDWNWAEFVTKPDQSYERFERELKERFDDTFGNGRAHTRASAMKYTNGNLLDHVGSVLQVLSKEEYLPEVSRINIVLEGLPEDIRETLRIREPQTREELQRSIRIIYPQRCQPPTFLNTRHQYD